MKENKNMALWVKGIFESGTDKQIADITVAVVGRVPTVAVTDQALITIIFIANIANEFETRGQNEMFEFLASALYRFEYSDELIQQGKFSETLSYGPFVLIIYELLDSFELDPVFFADFVEYLEGRLDNIKYYMNY